MANKMTFFSRFFLCFLLLCFGCRAVPPEQLQTFQNAQSAFDAGEYRQSAALYETLLEQGVRSGTIYYNLGNAWAKADEPVRAVVAYSLAKRYLPNDPHLNANLRTVLLNHGAVPPPSDSSGLILFWQDWIGIDTKIWGSLALAALTFLGGVFCLFGQFQGLKRYFIGVAILTVIALVSVGYDWYRFEGVVLVAAEALPRKGNSEQYEPAFVSPIPFGTQAVVLDERNGWYSLRFPSGQDGWLPQSHTVHLR
jgi:tetratricopeptide (TPR) repeat protein